MLDFPSSVYHSKKLTSIEDEVRKSGGNWGRNMFRVKIQQLQEGCILAEDVVGKTQKPIIPKNTVLTPTLLNILEKFLIEDVYVESVLANGQPFKPAEVIPQSSPNETIEEEELITLYLAAVHRYKKAFQSWQAGVAIDINEVRAIILPLLDRFIDNRNELLTLYRYTTKEDYLCHHAVSVGLLSGFLAKCLNYKKGDYCQIALAGFLSNCGMAKIDEKILILNP